MIYPLYITISSDIPHKISQVLVACHRKSLRSTPHSAATSFGMASAVHGGRCTGGGWIGGVGMSQLFWDLVYLGLSWFLGTRSSRIIFRKPMKHVSDASSLG